MAKDNEIIEEIEATEIDVAAQDMEQVCDEEVAQNPQSASKYTRLMGEDNVKKLTGMYKNWFLDYASYVILERAVPHIDDGLKPVQPYPVRHGYRLR